MKTGSREGGFLVLGGAVAMALGVFLPWVKLTAPIIGTISKAGIDGDGKLVLALAVAVGVCGYLVLTSRGRMWASITALVIALAGAAIMIFEAIDTQNRFASITQSLSGNPFAGAFSYGLDFGFYLTCLGVVACLVGGVVGLAARQLPTVEEADVTAPNAVPADAVTSK
jgi:hypothetical protein